MAFQVDSTHREAIQAGFGIRTGTKRILILKAYPEMYKNCLASQIIRLEVCIVTKSHSPPVSHHGHELEVLMSKPPYSLPSTAPRMCGDLFYAAHGHPRYHGGCGRHIQPGALESGGYSASCLTSALPNRVWELFIVSCLLSCSSLLPPSPHPPPHFFAVFLILYPIFIFLLF